MLGIQDWSSDLKLKINSEKIKLNVFITDERNRQTYPKIRIFSSVIEQITQTKYFGLTLDTEIRFSKYLKETSNTALKQLNILRKQCGSIYDSKPF